MRPPPTLLQIETDLRAENQETRGRAMQSLLMRAKKEPSLHPAALPLFQRMLATAPDAWTVTSAARGVELIQGPIEGRKAWLTLLQHPNETIAATAASSVDVTTYHAELRQMLASRPEPAVQVAVIRTLGRSRNSEFLPKILGYLILPQTRVGAILALEQLEDPRALPNLEPLLQDDSDSGMTDDRGCPLRICDLAASASRRLQYVARKPYPPAMTAAAKNAPAITPQPASAVKPAVSATKKFRFPSQIFPYVPLISVLLGIPWVAIVGQLSPASAGVRTRAQIHAFDLVAMIPAFVGLVAASGVLLRRSAKRRAEIVCLALGTAGCGLMAIPFVSELLH